MHRYIISKDISSTGTPSRPGSGRFDRSTAGADGGGGDRSTAAVDDVDDSMIWGSASKSRSQNTSQNRISESGTKLEERGLRGAGAETGQLTNETGQPTETDPTNPDYLF
jgi:hypothetical protein